MKRKPAEFKRLARETLTRHYGVPMGAMVVTELILMVLSIPFSWDINVNSSVREWIIYCVSSIAITLLGVVFSIGNLRIVLNMARKKPYAFRDLFYGFPHHPDRYILAALLLLVICLVPAIPFAVILVTIEWANSLAMKLIIVLIASAILIIGEIYISLNYALIYFLLLDHPQMKILEAFRESRQMMEGNKIRMFYLVLTFIGWGILAVLSLGIGYLWIAPYIMETKTFFYLELAGELDTAAVYE